MGTTPTWRKSSGQTPASGLDPKQNFSQTKIGLMCVATVISGIQTTSSSQNTYSSTTTHRHNAGGLGLVYAEMHTGSLRRVRHSYLPRSFSKNVKPSKPRRKPTRPQKALSSTCYH